MRQWIEYALLRVAEIVVGRLPRRTQWFIAGVVASVIARAHANRFVVAKENLQKAFPSWNPFTVQHTAKQSIRHLLQTFFEMQWLAHATREGVAGALSIANISTAKRLLDKYHRVIFLSAHFGNWELGALSCALQLGTTFTIVGKPQRNSTVDRYLNRMRERFGNHIVPMEGAVRSMLRALEQHGSVALLADQSGSPQDLFVPFFGRPAATTSAPAAISLKLDVPIILGVVRRQPDLNFCIEFVEVDRSGLSGYSETNVFELTRRHVQLLESLIRKTPEQWLWMHKRWKHLDHAPIP